MTSHSKINSRQGCRRRWSLLIPRHQATAYDDVRRRTTLCRLSTLMTCEYEKVVTVWTRNSAAWFVLNRRYLSCKSCGMKTVFGYAHSYSNVSPTLANFDENQLSDAAFARWSLNWQLMFYMRSNYNMQHHIYTYLLSTTYVQRLPLQYFKIFFENV
jgi:hypothetical protein